MSIDQFIDNKGEFVGGCDIIREMFQSGELKFLLKDKGVAAKATA
jgi:monothiol glutaredoxin